MSSFKQSRRRFAFIVKLLVIGVFAYMGYTYYQGMAEIAEPLINGARLQMEQNNDN